MDRIDLATSLPRALRSRRLPGVVSIWRSRRALRAARRAADAELLTSEFPSARTAWRAAELTAPKNRLGLEHAIRQLLRSADARYLPGAAPLNRLAVREEAGRLGALADRLADLHRHVTPRGVLLLERLLTDGYGPLYVSYRAVELRGALLSAAEALEVHR